MRVRAQGPPNKAGNGLQWPKSNIGLDIGRRSGPLGLDGSPIPPNPLKMTLLVGNIIFCFELSGDILGSESPLEGGDDVQEFQRGGRS